MLNRMTLIGRLGRDPEMRNTNNGTPVTNLRIATDEIYTDCNGKKAEHTEWHNVVVFQRLAENCKTYLRRGSLVYVEGSLQTRKWQDQFGQDRYTTEIKATKIQFLDRKGSQNEPELPTVEQQSFSGKGERILSQHKQSHNDDSYILDFTKSELF